MPERVEIIATGRDSGAGRLLGGLTGDMRQLQQVAPSIGQGFSRIGAGLTSPLRMVSRTVGSVVNLQNALVAGAGAMAAKALFEPAINLQRWETEFAVLLGGVDEARARIEELSAFSATTPFQLPGIVAASKTLETLTNGALSTGPGLRMIGDAAAFAGQPIEEIAVHFGRLYDAMQSGRPAGESMMRLQELGIISGSVRNELEEMQKTGADSSDMWATLTAAVSRFDGTMADVSMTAGGKISTLKDNLSLAFADISTEALDELVEVIDDMLAGIEELRESGQLSELGEELGTFLKAAYEDGKAFAKWVDENKDWLIKLGITVMSVKVIADTTVGIVQLTAAVKALAAVQIPAGIASMLGMGTAGAGAGAAAGGAGAVAKGAAAGGAGAAGATVGSAVLAPLAVVTGVAASMYTMGSALGNRTADLAEAKADAAGEKLTGGKLLGELGLGLADWALQLNPATSLADKFGIGINQNGMDMAAPTQAEIQQRRQQLTININEVRLDANTPEEFVFGLQNHAARQL